MSFQGDDRSDRETGNAPSSVVKNTSTEKDKTILEKTKVPVNQPTGEMNYTLRKTCDVFDSK